MSRYARCPFSNATARLVIVLSFCLISFAGAVEIRLKPPNRARVIDRQLAIDALAGPNLLEDEVRAYLNYGIVLTFTYFIELHEKKWLWDETLAQITITKRISYDLWTEQYLLETSYPRPRQALFRDLVSLKPELEVLTAIPICDASRLKPGARYYFKTRNTLKVTQLNSFFHVLFNLLSIFKYKTTWLTSPVYPGEQLLTGIER